MGLLKTAQIGCVGSLRNSRLRRFELRRSATENWTLDERREKGDMIMLFSLVTGRVKLDIDDYIILGIRGTRGHMIKFEISRGDTDANKILVSRTILSNKL